MTVLVSQTFFSIYILRPPVISVFQVCFSSSPALTHTPRLTLGLSRLMCHHKRSVLMFCMLSTLCSFATLSGQLRSVLFYFSCFRCSLLTFQEVLSGTLSECQTVWVQIRTDRIRSGSKLITKVIRRRQKAPLVRKEVTPPILDIFIPIFIYYTPPQFFIQIHVVCSTPVLTCI